MPWEIDLFIELAQGGGGGLNLINITCGIERLAEILHRSLGLLGGLLGGAGFQHVRHGVASEFHAGIIDQSRDQFICQLRVGFLDELKGQSTCARFLFLVRNKIEQRLLRQLASPIGDGVYRGAEPVGGQRRGILHGAEDLR